MFASPLMNTKKVDRSSMIIFSDPSHQITVRLVNAKTGMDTIVRNVEATIESENHLSLNTILKELKNLGFPLNNSQIFYYCRDSDLYINCGYFPFHHLVKIST